MNRYFREEKFYLLMQEQIMSLIAFEINYLQYLFKLVHRGSSGL